MFIRIGYDIIDTDLLDIQGLQWRLRNEQLQTKFTSRQFSNYGSKASIRNINEATNNDPDLIKINRGFQRQLQDFDRRRLRYTGEPRQVAVLNFGAGNIAQLDYNGVMSTNEFIALLRPHVSNGRLIKVLVAGRDEYDEITTQDSVFTEQSPYQQYKQLMKLLSGWVYFRLGNDYDATPELRILRLQIVQLPARNAPLQHFRDGVYNCAVQPVIEYLKTLNDTDVNRKRIKRCEKLNTLYFETGIDNEGLTTLAKAACVVLRVMDASKAVWETFGDVNAKRHELILYAHNNHFKHILAAEVKNINTNIFTKDQEVEWVKPDFNYAELNRQFLEAQQIESKGKQVALITPTLIYKSEFNECEKFPNQFTDGGVGKQSF